MAALEEFLQQKYVEYYDEISNETDKAVALESVEPNYFYSTNLGYIPDANGNALYLINKSGLPDEIKDGLIGGNAGDGSYIDYMNLNDVYGVTSSLKVYYCASGLDSMIGATVADLTPDNPQRTVVASSSSVISFLSSYDSDGDGSISSNEAKRVKELTISNVNITDLNDIGYLSSLQKLTLDGVTLKNLNGLEKCGNLYYIFFKNCEVEDYSNLKKLSNNLSYLYFYCINDTEFSKICSKDTGIGGKDFSKLTGLAFVGNTGNIRTDLSNITTTHSDKSSKTITNISDFSNLSDNTKANVKYLFLQNNNINSLSGIEKFTGVAILRLEYNKLTSIDELNKLTSLSQLYISNNTDLEGIGTFSSGSGLKYIVCQNNKKVTTLKGLANCNELIQIYFSSCNLGYNCDGTTKDSSKDAIASLKGKDKLTYIDLQNNPYLIWVDYLSENTVITTLYLAGCTGMDADSLSNLRKIINNISNYSYPNEYKLAMLDDDVKTYSLSDMTISKKEFLGLKNKKSMTSLTLSNLNIVDTVEGSSETKSLSANEVNKLVNEVLATMTGLEVLTISADDSNYNISQVSTIDFIGEDENEDGTVTEKVKKLTYLKLYGVSVVDLSLLDTWGLNLKTLYLCGNMELSGIQNTINALYLNNFDSIDNVIRDRGAGLGLIGSTILKKLEGLTEIKYLWSYRVGCGNFYGNIDLDLSGCSSLEKIKGYANFANIGKLILPSSLTVYEPNNNKVNEIDFSRCVNLKQLSFPDCSFSILGDKIKTIESVKNLKNIESIYITETGDYANLDWLENFKNSKITSFTWTSDQQKRYTLDDISGLKYLKNLTSLKLSYINASSLDALKPVYDEENKLVSGCPNLSTIDINVSSIYSLESLSNITALTYIRVENSGVTGIGNFKKLVNLEVLNLQNNPLYDIETDENENVSEIFKDLNKKSLKYLRLYGTLLQNWEWTKECSFAAYSGW